MGKMVEAGRLAFRHEGDWWNCYYAPQQHNMEGAILVGSVLIRLAHGPAKKAFMDSMRAVFEVMCADVGLTVPEWQPPKVAPEHERSGHS